MRGVKQKNPHISLLNCPLLGIFAHTITGCENFPDSLLRSLKAKLQTSLRYFVTRIFSKFTHFGKYFLFGLPV